jgi:hypothetical protein
MVYILRIIHVSGSTDQYRCQVKVAVDEAKAEHDILKAFAEGADAGDFGAPP